MSELQLLTVCQVANLLHISRRSVWRYESLGWLPRGIRLTPGTVRWDKAALLAWLERRRALEQPVAPNYRNDDAEARTPPQQLVPRGLRPLNAGACWFRKNLAIPA